MWPSENAKEEEGGLILQTKLEKLIGCGALNYARDPGDVTVEATRSPTDSRAPTSPNREDPETPMKQHSTMDDSQKKASKIDRIEAE
ncbi:hypothetical protein ISN44_As06g002090 [Arabidopsis suecica]|uniref:Uncharacterized protein n=1 Tax=Arabidopsis suecica TaxID=45249 RepID=A0A8T2C8H9_ARASU|nr:hypothetical protein ISN44_As06g002090 [Arabidopsis suecica]